MANAAEITTSIMRQKARRKQEFTFLTIAAIMVIACVVAWLHVDGVATTGEAMCGYEEHSHSAECYELVYTCGYEEGEVLSAAPDYEAIEAQIRAEFEAEIAVLAEEQALALQEAQEAAAAEAEAAGEDPEAAREAVAAAADPAPVVDEVALSAAVEAAYAEAEAATEVHTHSEACTEARLVCELEEHTHVPLCYSNSNIDVETPEEWEATFADVELTGAWPQDVVAIAQTQVGYSESEQNFILGDDGERHGYTRYGAWYENPYGAWDGPFVMFCLEYAGVDTDYLPCESGAYAWTAALQRASAYEPAHAYTPNPGDLVFFNDDYENNDKADRVGIVKSVNEDLDELVVIEGDVNNMVAETPYTLSSDAIQGYCNVADRQALAEDPGNGVIPIDKYAPGEGVEGVDGEELGEGDGTGDEAANEGDENTDGVEGAGSEGGDDGADDTDAAEGEGGDGDGDKAADEDGAKDEGDDQDATKLPGDKADGDKDPAKTDKPKDTLTPDPADDAEGYESDPIYAAFVNGDGEMIVLEDEEDPTMADENAEEDDGLSQGDTDETSDESAQEASIASGSRANSKADQQVATSDDDGSFPEVSREDSEDLSMVPTAPEGPSGDVAAPNEPEPTDLRSIDDVNDAAETEPLDFGEYITAGSVAYRSSDTDEWALVEDGAELHEQDLLQFTLEYELPQELLSQESNSVACLVAGVQALDAQKGYVLEELSDKKIGTYEVSEDGAVRLAFDDASVQQNEENAIKGTVAFECDASSLTVDEDGKVAIALGLMEPVTFAVVHEPDDDTNKDGEEKPGEEVKNEAVKDEESQDKEKSDDSEEYATFSFTKIDGDTEKPLNGVKFEVYEYNRETSEYELFINSIESGKLDTPGLVEIGNLEYNTAYKLVEASTIEGYEPLTDPIYFDVRRESADEEPVGEEVLLDDETLDPASHESNNYPADFAFSSDLLLAQDDGSYVLKNYRPRTSITVEVVWEPADSKTASVEIQLGRIAKDNNGTVLGRELLSSKTATLSGVSTDQWTHTFEGLLPVGLYEGKEVSYEYYAIERPNPLYALIGVTSEGQVLVEKTGDVVITAEDGDYENVTGVPGGSTITLTNKYNDTGYRLPNSGGSGVFPYYIGGGLVAVAAAMVIFARRRRGCVSERGNC